MKYVELFRVSLQHPFYADGKTPDFAIRASAETLQLVRNHRAILRTSPAGVRLLVPLDDAGEPFLPLAADAAFRFHLLLENRDFALFTDLAALAELTAPLWTNAGVSDGALVLVEEKKEEEEEEEDSLLPQRPRGVFADVEVLPGSTDLDTVREFAVTFLAKRARWAYYCVTDLAAADLGIGIPDGGSAPFARRKLNENPDPADRIAVQLADRYPEKRRIRFLSDDLVACRQHPGHKFELRLGGARVAGPLPTPSIRNHSTIEIESNGSLQQVDSLFQLIRYLKPPLSQSGE